MIYMFLTRFEFWCIYATVETMQEDMQPSPLDELSLCGCFYGMSDECETFLLASLDTPL